MRCLGRCPAATAASDWLPALPRPPATRGQTAREAVPWPGAHPRCCLAGKDMESNGPSLPRDEGPPTPGSATKVSPVDYRLCNGSDKECVSPTAKVTKKETLKAQKESYRQEKKRASKQLFSALTDPSAVIMADSLKIRGTLKSWTKLWCVLKPGVLLIYKTPKVGQWVGTVLLHCCELLERPSKKDGFCFKLFHPLDQSVWAVKGPKGESVGSITQPLPSSYLIFRAASELDGRCWLDALELALRCSSLLRLSTCKQGSDREPGSSPDASPSSLCGLPPSATSHDQDLFPLNGSSLENDAFSDKSERELAQESDDEAQDHSRKTNESGSDRSDAPGGPAPRGTTYVEQVHEELGEGIKKPYNPILGETFRCRWYHPQTDSHTFYIAEQVSHHPPVSAFHVSNRKDGFCISGSITAKSRFYGNSLSALLDGKATLTFLSRGEEYTLTMPYAHCKGILYGTMTMELGGRVTIACKQSSLQADLEFKLKVVLGPGSSEPLGIPRPLCALEVWDPLKDIAQFEQDGVLHTLQRETPARQTRFVGSPGPRRQGPGPDWRLRKASDQPSGHSQATESSGSTPESCPELSDEDDGFFAPGSESPCPRCGKEARRLRALHEAILSIREAQQELHRHLSAMLSSTARARQPPATGLLQRPRSWFLLCVFLACQLLINYILT
ncbi:oxysterol-binding protein-related protein 5 [Pteropus vampyrus]|uniref:Oxysterol-binding protein n=1 Tax=Pteropus vampyrus TaxID=132908 RepID=A0A6P6D022_PTEVA|nr:oxysterol-binding protein-related protein 5 [Pteropus vampyrus]